MDNNKEYFAFISYKREDEKWAVWLQNKLEHYKLPSNMNGRTDLPKEIRPIFRDQSDLAAGVLADEIQKALEASKYLIVICSPRAAKSPWVGKEVQSFIDMGRTDRIIPFIIGGTAHAQDPMDECFPSALLSLPPEQELIGINIDEMGRDAAAVKVVAQMFELKFDALWQRYEREKKKKHNWILAVSVVTFLVVLGIAGWIWMQNVEIRRQNNEIRKKELKMMENQSRFVAEKALKLVNDEDSYMAQRLLLDVLSDSIHPERPYTAEADMALREALRHNSAFLRGHSGFVQSAVFSPDGEQIASASSDTTIRIWDAETGSEIKVLKGHCNTVLSAEYSPDGKHIVSTSLDGTIRIWNVNNSTDTETLIVHSEGINYASYNPDGTQIVSASAEGIIRIWDAVTGNLLKTLKGHHSMIRRVTYNYDGSLIASGSADSTIRVWDVQKGIHLKTLIGHRDYVNSVEFSPDGKQIVSSSDDCTIKIWDVKSGSLLNTLTGHNPISASFSFDGNYILSCSYYDNNIIIWDVKSGIPIRVIDEHYPVFSVCYSPDGRKMVSVVNDENYTIKLRGEDVEDSIDTLTGHTDAVISLSFSPDGRFLVSAALDETIKVWDVLSKQLVNSRSGRWKVYNTVTSVSYSPDGMSIASAYDDQTIRIWDSKMTGIIKDLQWDSSDGLFLSIASKSAFSPDGERIVAVASNAQAIIWDVVKRTSARKLIGQHIHYAEFSPDGTQIITTTNDSLVIIWNATTGEIDKTIKLNGKGSLNMASFSPNGEMVAISTDKNVIIWDAVNNKELRTILDAESAFFVSNNYIITFSNEPFYKTIRIWDSKTGRQIKTIGKTSRNTWRLCPVSISYDGRYIACALDSLIVIYPFPSLQDLIDQTRERFKDRQLTPAERHQYYLE